MVFGEIPHHVDDYVLLQLTKIMGIKTVCMQCGILSKTFITNANLETIEGNNYNDLEELKDMLRETAENLKDWSKYLPAVDASKGYKPKTGIAKNYKELLKEGLHEDFIEIGGNYLGEMKNSSEIFEEEKKYILYLLHMEPESAVYPMSTKCISQSSVLDILSILFPEHQIVIKEHPHMYSKEVERLIPWRTEHLSLVREEINTIIRDNKCMMWSSPTKETEELLANADALVCLNGSTGLMGLLSGIPTFVAKGSYLSGCNGTKNIDECNNIELEELKKSINNNKEGRIQEIALHLSKRLYKSHLITLHEKSQDEITSQDLIANIKKAMEKV